MLLNMLIYKYAAMVELVDTLESESSIEKCASSSLASCTKSGSKHYVTYRRKGKSKKGHRS